MSCSEAARAARRPAAWRGVPVVEEGGDDPVEGECRQRRIETQQGVAESGWQRDGELRPAGLGDRGWASTGASTRSRSRARRTRARRRREGRSAATGTAHGRASNRVGTMATARAAPATARSGRPWSRAGPGRGRFVASPARKAPGKSRSRPAIRNPRPRAAGDRGRDDRTSSRFGGTVLSHRVGLRRTDLRESRRPGT